MEPGAQCVATLQGHTGWIICVTLLSDGRFVSGSSDHTLKIWDPGMDTGSTMCRYPAGAHWLDKLRPPAPRWPIRLRLLR